jgi:hypothetical protein
MAGMNVSLSSATTVCAATPALNAEADEDALTSTSSIVATSAKGTLQWKIAMPNRGCVAKMLTLDLFRVQGTNFAIGFYFLSSPASSSISIDVKQNHCRPFVISLGPRRLLL